MNEYVGLIEIDKIYFNVNHQCACTYITLYKTANDTIDSHCKYAWEKNINFVRSLFVLFRKWIGQVKFS